MGVFCDLGVEFETLWDLTDRKTVILVVFLDNMDSACINLDSSGIKNQDISDSVASILPTFKICLLFVVQLKFLTAGVPL